MGGANRELWYSGWLAKLSFKITCILFLSTLGWFHMNFNFGKIIKRLLMKMIKCCFPRMLITFLFCT